MPDPVIQVPNPVIASNSNVESILADADAARADFFAQADDVFAGQQAQAGRSQALPAPRPLQPAQPSAAPGAVPSQAPPSKPAAPAVGKSVPGPSSPAGKVPGPPGAANAQAPQAQAPGVAQQAPVQQQAPVPPVEDDLPREYRPGSIRAEQWNKMHATRDALRVERDTFKQQLAEAQAKLQSAVPNEQLQQQFTTLKQERDAFLEKLEAVAFERSPRFEAMFKPRVEAAISLAKNALGPEHATKIEQLLSMPDSEFRNVQLNALAEGLPPLALGKLANAIGEVDRANSERAALAAKGSEQWRAWQQEEQQRQQGQFEASSQQIEQAFNSEFAGWKDFEMFREKPGDTAHNTAVQQRIATAKGILSGGLDPQELSRAALWATLGPDLIGALTAERQRAGALEQELASLRAAQPGPGSDNGAPAANDDVDSSLGYGAGIAALAAREGLLR